MRIRAVLALTVLSALTVLPACGRAQAAHLDLPSLEHLSRKATETVNITVGGVVLSAASLIIGSSDPEAREMLRGLKSIQVRSFAFDADEAYSVSDIASVQRQLTGPHWSSLVQTRDRKEDSNVDIYVCIENEKPVGLAIISREPRELTIVNIVGTIDLSHLAKLQGQFGVPRSLLAQR